MLLIRLSPARIPLNGFAQALRDEWTRCRALGASCLGDRRVRRVLKASLDFLCGAIAFGVGIALSEGVAAFGAAKLTVLAASVGALLVIAEAVGGGYRTMWRYTSLSEAVAVGISSMIVLIGLFFARSTALIRISAATALLIALLILFLSISLRALRRWQALEPKRLNRSHAHPALEQAPHRIMIAGAGEHGLSICRDLIRTKPDGVDVVGFVDDDPAKIGASMDGIPVLGPLSEALSIAERYDVSEVIVAMPSTAPDVVRALERRLEDAGVRVRAVRGVERFVMGRDLRRPGSATAFDRFDYGRSGIEGLQHPRLEVLQGDICNSRTVSRAVRDVEGVLALAAIVGDPACNLDPEETIDLNYAATKILIEACNFYGVRRLVFASSCSVYGANSHGMLTERSRLNPVSLYARTRVLSENIVFDRRGDVEPVVVRLATVFGLSPRMRFDLVVNTLTVRAVVDKKISIFGGNQWRPNVHCRDAARAFIQALEAPAEIVAGEVFNVGGDALNHRIAELGAMVAEIVGEVEIVQLSEAADARDYRVSFEKARRALGFVPEFTVARGIAEVAAAVRGDAVLRHHHQPLFHNVQALKQRFEAHARLRELPAT